MRRYRLRFWEPLLAAPVTGRPFHLGDGMYTFSADGGDIWLTDAHANLLVVAGAERCTRPLAVRQPIRPIVSRFGHDGAPYRVLDPVTPPAALDSGLAGGLPLDFAGLRRFFAIEDELGWDLFPKIRLVERFSRESPPDDTVEVDLRHGRFRIGPANGPDSLRVRYFHRYDVDALRARVREELMHAVPVGRCAVVVFRDTPVPGHTAR